LVYQAKNTANKIIRPFYAFLLLSIAKELGDEIISDYASNTSSSSLSLLPQSDEQQPWPTKRLPEAKNLNSCTYVEEKNMDLFNQK